MLKFSHLSLRRGVKELLHDVSLVIHAKQKVGITGANGVGKSSLFALILGELHADTGEFSMPANTVIAHVAQEIPALNKSAIEYVLDGDTELRRIEQAIHTAEQQRDDHLVRQAPGTERLQQHGLHVDQPHRIQERKQRDAKYDHHAVVL